MLVTRARCSRARRFDYAAGGGVGSVGIQVAKLRGARVIDTDGSVREAGEGARARGDEVVNYTREDWPKEIRRLTASGAWTWSSSTRRGDVAGVAPVPEAQRAARPCGATRGWTRAQTCGTSLPPPRLLGSFMGRRRSVRRDGVRRARADTRRVDRELPLAEARRAHELIEDRAQSAR